MWFQKHQNLIQFALRTPNLRRKGQNLEKKKKKVSHDYQEAMTIQGEQTGILKNKLKECPGKLA